MVMVTSTPVKEMLTPSPDGVTLDFQTSQAYKSGTVSVWVNGLRKIQDWDDGFEELGGTTIRMKEAPLTGDSLHAMYEVA